MTKIVSLALILICGGCSTTNESQVSQPQPILEQNNPAQVLKVEATGEANNYTFAVTVSSPDSGCDRYANWWEVITPDEQLLYRRVLLHSHVEEQPFTRTGGTVAIQPQQEVIVRVHMSPDGYSSRAQKGTVQDGFSEVTLPTDFATSLASAEPLPSNCAF